MKQNKTIGDIYPLTIVSDRYGGTYSGGNYIAFNNYAEQIPSEINSDDTCCMSFWDLVEIENPELIFGLGETIEEACNNLLEKINKNENNR